jgi:hypothetical protein
MQRIFFIIAAILINTISFAQQLPFNLGEKFTYDVRLFGFKIGTQIDEVIGIERINNQQTYHLRSIIKSNPFFSKFYHLSEQIDSWVGTSTLLPVHVIVDIDRKKYRKCYVYSIDYTHQKVTILHKHRNIIKTTNILPNTLDSLSLIYYLRTQDLKVGNSYNLSMLHKDGVKKIKVDIIKEEKVSTPYGRFMALKAKHSGTGITVWFTQDKAHIPIKIEVKTSAGLLQAYLRMKE